MGYNAKVYRKQGGDEVVVADGGKITVEAGGTIEAGEASIIPVEMQAAIADLDLTVSDPPTQAQVQDIADKVDAILAALRLAEVIEAGD